MVLTLHPHPRPHPPRCPYSKVWNLRVTALTSMAEMIHTDQITADGRTVVHTVCRVVQRCCNDKMVQVYLAAMALFTALFSKPHVDTLPRNEWSHLVSPLTPQWLAKLGDGNVRVRDATQAGHHASHPPCISHVPPRCACGRRPRLP